MSSLPPRSNVYFTADLHLGHNNVTNFRYNTDGTYIDPDKHDQMIIDNILSTVGEEDRLFILGDVCFTKDAYNTYFKQLVGKIKNITVVLGNHDSTKKVPLSLYIEDGIHVVSSYVIARYTLTHIPVHPNELKTRKLVGNIHGHMHYDSIRNNRYYCVSIENSICNFKPLSLRDIRKLKNERLDISTTVS